MELFERLSLLVESGKADAKSNYPREMRGQPGVREIVRDAVGAGFPPMAILEQGLARGMRLLGKKFSTGEIFIPEVLMAMKALNAGVEELKPYLSTEQVHPKGKVLVGTVEGDIHDIGKNLVRMLLESAGYEVVDLGVGVTPEAFVEAVKAEKPIALALSALLTTTMERMRDTVKAVRDAGLTVPVLIGGAPVTDRFADEIGAVYGAGPQEAIEILDSMKVAA